MTNYSNSVHYNHIWNQILKETLAKTKRPKNNIIVNCYFHPGFNIIVIYN